MQIDQQFTSIRKPQCKWTHINANREVKGFSDITPQTVSTRKMMFMSKGNWWPILAELGSLVILTCIYAQHVGI